MTLSYGKEIFPIKENKEFSPLFHDHGNEVRGQPFKLNYGRYRQIENDGRLIWIVARSAIGAPVGYACSFWYQDLHFDERVAADDLWYVAPACRGDGVGRTIKLMCHAELKKQGVVRVYDIIRASGFSHGTLMRDIGFDPWGIKWKKEL